MDDTNFMTYGYVSESHKNGSADGKAVKSVRQWLYKKWAYEECQWKQYEMVISIE
ncbi:hypothetical protein GCM10011513_03410 [Franconibacter daqui]|nr:hypothetical protein GCM10011513_03410 [Franconibacter daqui]